MKARQALFGALGFGLSSSFAVTRDWSLPEFCWSTWVAGLGYAWCCTLVATLQIILTARSDRPLYERRFAFLRRWPDRLFLAVTTTVSVFAGLAAFRLYSVVFGFYGLFLSVFAEMEPSALFGRNGFINSDFFTPVMVLADRFWPMLLGLLLANGVELVRKNPWARILLPFQAEVLRVHVLILALPFFSLLAWAFVGRAYQPLAIVLLMGLLYLLPNMAREKPD